MVRRPNPHHAGPWLSTESLARLPRVGRDFQLGRDPHIRAQTLDLEGQSQGERGGRGAAMVRQDRPQPAPTPPPEIRKAVDSAQFNGRWLAQHRDAAMTQAKRPAHSGRSTEHGPRRSRTPEP